MKKFLLSAALLTSAVMAFGADYSVYQNGTLAEGLTVEKWWNLTINAEAANPDGDGKVVSMTYGDAGTSGGNFCGGFLAHSGSSITGPLHSATLTFSYYATKACKMTIRLTAGDEENQVVTVTADDINKWNQVSFNVAEKYPAVAAAWQADKEDGEGFVFSAVVEELSEGLTVYFNNINYTDIDASWVKPEQEKPFCPTPAVPERPKTSVISLLSGAYTPATTFGIGGWGQTTKVKTLTADNGAPVQYLTNFNYLGWELAEHIDVSECDYLHVEYYTTDGTAFGFTPISEGPGHERVKTMAEVKQNEWNVYDIALTEWDNVDLKDLFQMKWDLGNGCEAYLANVYFYNSEDKVVNPEPEPVVPEHLYVVGTLKDAMNTPESALEMNKEGNTFSVDVTFENGTETESTFTFIPAQGTWEEVYGGIVYGAADADVFAVGEAKALAIYDADSETAPDEAPVFHLNYVGDATIVVDFDNMTVTVTKAEGIEAIEAETATAVYYNLQGVRVANPANGIFIKKAGSTVSKVLVK